MNYAIVTGLPKQLRCDIVESVKNGEDKNGSDIQTWDVKNATFREDGKEISEEVLVHTAQAWKNVGGLRLIIDKEGNNKLYVKFFYWSDYSKDLRDESLPSYLFGRVTELLLAHFFDEIRAISITK